MTWQSFLFMAAFAVGVAFVTYMTENSNRVTYDEVPVRPPNLRRREIIISEVESDDEPEYSYTPRPAITDNSNRSNRLFTPQSPSGRLPSLASPRRSAPVPRAEPAPSSSTNCQYPDCAICLEQLSPVSTLTCGHTFHVNCINLTRNAEIEMAAGFRAIHKCPYCRTQYHL